MLNCAFYDVEKNYSVAVTDIWKLSERKKKYLEVLIDDSDALVEAQNLLTTVPTHSIVFPKYDDMLKRLLTVEDNQYICESVFPTLLKEAGTSKDPNGVVFMLHRALCNLEENYSLPMEGVSSENFSVMKENFLRALIDDPVALEEAQNVLKN